jgi:hypothetical protein
MMMLSGGGRRSSYTIYRHFDLTSYADWLVRGIGVNESEFQNSFKVIK